jgi:hypothetical protein
MFECFFISFQPFPPLVQQSGLLAPFGQQYCPFPSLAQQSGPEPPLAQQSGLFAPFAQQKGPIKFNFLNKLSLNLKNC